MRPGCPAVGLGASMLPSPGWRLELPSLGFRMSPRSLCPSLKLSQPEEGAGGPALAVASLSLASRRGSRLPGCHTGRFPSPGANLWPTLLFAGWGPCPDQNLYLHQHGAFGFPSLVPRGPVVQRAGGRVTLPPTPHPETTAPAGDPHGPSKGAAGPRGRLSLSLPCPGQVSQALGPQGP